MPKSWSQRGLAPIVLILIFTVVIAGVAGVAYQSRKEIKVRSDKSTEVTELKGTPSPSPKSADVAADQTGRLADKPVELKLDDSAASSPRFSITPPAGWGKLPPEGNYMVEFLSPSKDQITEGGAYFYVQPNITVYVSRQFKSIDEAVAAARFDSTHVVNQRSKSIINGQEAYIFESVKDFRDLAKDLLGAQLKEEIAKAEKEGTQLSEDSKEEMQKNMDKVLEQTKGKILSYLFYKDGYYINVTGKSLESFWDKRGPQIRKSMDSFKLE